ncbi:MAG: flavin reductase family protein [Parvibaculaceae bacterium]
MQAELQRVRPNGAKPPGMFASPLAPPAGAGGPMRAGRTEFLRAMSNVANSVTVVATDGPGGRFGQTVSSFCSVSADPPQMLCCIRAASPVRGAIEMNGCFAINVLSDRQADIADAFAGRPARFPAYSFNSISHGLDENGCPMIGGSSSLYSCRLVNAVSSGSHVVFIGNVTWAGYGADAPLLYRARGYGRHAGLEQSR